MGHDIPKQFIEIEGKPILRHTIERFMESFDEIEIIVIPSGRRSIEGVLQPYRFFAALYHALRRYNKVSFSSECS